MVKLQAQTPAHFGASSNPPSAIKRKKFEDEDLASPAVNAIVGNKRFEIEDFHANSCKCVARKVPDLCKAYTPGKTDQDLSARLSRLEHIIEMALPQYCIAGPSRSPANASTSQQRSLSDGDDDSPSQTEDQDPSGGSFQSGKWYGKSALGSVAPGSVLEQLQNMGVSTEDEDQSSRHPLDSKNLDLTPIPPHSHVSVNGEGQTLIEEDLEPSAADNLKSLVQECGVSPHKISELLQELPPARSSDVLIDYYFSSM
ncbi:hypothetical protein C0993_001612 [Termitomyces sp. T159_Od127]|nr:hypothetical protein C0993_001612 [Termitomyces sp. T159_Od127]